MERDDTCPIKNPDTLAEMYTCWMHDWIKENMTEKQRNYPAKKKSSIFSAYLHQNVGNKHFVMALWQTGVQWAPSRKMLKNDYHGAIEHVAKNFAKWSQRVVRAIIEHKKDIDTENARRRSGNSSYGKHGLTAEEEQLRQARYYHRLNYYWALELNHQLQVSKGKRYEMSHNDWWYLEEIWSGSLRAELRRVDSYGYKVQAPDFVVEE